MSSSHLYLARWLLPGSGRALEGGGLVVEDGRIAGLFSAGDARAATGVERTDLGDVILTPGLVDAHAHLELAGAPELRGDQGFGAWIGEVLARRATLDRADYDAAVAEGARRLVATGTLAVGDVDSTGAAEGGLPCTPLRARVFREVLDGGDAARTPGQLERLRAAAPTAEGLALGISPHGPHTVSGPLLEACVARARAATLPLQVHWAETPEEVAWLREGSGPLAQRLGASPRCSGLDLLERHGALTADLSLVHANHPEAGDLARVAAAGATLVHCPGTHEFFGRPPIDLGAWLASGATIALGTDSLASNTDLDLRLEMQRVRAAHPGLAPEVVLEWATRGGARALRLEDRIGELTVGKDADFVAFDAGEASRAQEAFDRVTAGRPAVRGRWIAGTPV